MVAELIETWVATYGRKVFFHRAILCFPRTMVASRFLCPCAFHASRLRLGRLATAATPEPASPEPASLVRLITDLLRRCVRRQWDRRDNATGWATLLSRHHCQTGLGLSQQLAADAFRITVCSAQVDRPGQVGRPGAARFKTTGPLWASTHASPPGGVADPAAASAENLPRSGVLRHKRTLRRRVVQWKQEALARPGAGGEGPAGAHWAGVLAISDFPLLKGEPITVATHVPEHRLVHVRPSDPRSCSGEESPRGSGDGATRPGPMAPESQARGWP